MRNFLVLLLAVTSLSAQAAVTETKTGIEFSGKFDAYYQYNFNKPGQPAAAVAGAPNPSAPATQRLYDNYHNQLTLNMIELGMKKEKGDVTIVADIDFGDIAQRNRAEVLGNTGGTTSVANEDNISQHVGQAHLTYRPSTVKGMFVQAGKFYSYMGNESAKAQDNWNYSRSYAYTYGIPVWHTGLAAGYGMDGLTGTLYYLNGWNTLYKFEAAPTWGGKLDYVSSDKRMSGSFSFITGRANYVFSNPASLVQLGIPATVNQFIRKKTVFDANAKMEMTKEFSIMGDLLYGMGNRDKDNDAAWWGVSAAAKFDAMPSVWVSPRLEFYEDKDDMSTGTRQSVKSLTLTGNYMASEGLDFRLEGRYDTSSQSVFRKSGFTVNTGNPAMSRHVLTTTLAALYSF